jgi:prevent-host-death family protein
MIQEDIDMTRESTYSISEIREAISHLPEAFEEDTDLVTVTRHGKPVMTILPTTTYESLKETIDSLKETVDSLIETLEVMSDPELMAYFRQGVKEMAEGKGRPWEEVKRELGLE